MRPSWDAYFMDMAKLVSTRATCDRKSVGAVLVSPERHVIATGYNGTGPGMPHCDEIGHLLSTVDGNEACVRTIHAEVNAIGMAAKLGVATKGSIMYCTTLPCLGCAKNLVAAGVSRVLYGERASDTRGLDYFVAAGVTVARIGE